MLINFINLINSDGNFEKYVFTCYWTNTEVDETTSTSVVKKNLALTQRWQV